MKGRVFLSCLLACSCVTAAWAGVPANAAAPAPAASQALSTTPTTDQVIVQYRPGVAASAQQAAERAAGASSGRAAPLLGTHHRVLKVANASAAVRALAQRPDVVAVEPDAVATPALTPNDPYFPWTYPSLDRLGGQIDRHFTKTPAAWDVTTGSSAVTIAIVDSGVAPHPDLVANLLPGYNTVDNNTSVVDPYGHGTQVAGMAAARGGNGIGVAGYCWTCRILPVKVSTNAATGYAYTSDAAEGIRWAVDHGAQIINVSYVFDDSSTLRAAVDHAATANVLVVAAAGNDGLDRPRYPAAYESVLAAGYAVASATTQLQPASNYGTWVDVAAPGGLTTSPAEADGTYYYQVAGGTSLASPAIAGAAALLLARAPGSTPAQLREALCTSAMPIVTGHAVRCGVLDTQALVGPTSPSPTPAPTHTPAPTPTPTTTPTPAPTSTPTPIPTSSPAPTATPTTTWTLTGSLSSRTPVRSFTLTAPVATVTVLATLSRKCASVTVAMTDSNARSTAVTVRNGQLAELWYAGGPASVRVSGCSGGFTVTLRAQT